MSVLRFAKRESRTKADLRPPQSCLPDRRLKQERPVPVEGRPGISPEEHQLVAGAADHLEITRVAKVALDHGDRIHHAQRSAKKGRTTPRQRRIVVVAPEV